MGDEIPLPPPVEDDPPETFPYGVVDVGPPLPGEEMALEPMPVGPELEMGEPPAKKRKIKGADYMKSRDDGLFVCSVEGCGHVSKNRAGGRLHFVAKHTQRFTCDECSPPRGFSCKSALAKHARTHTKEKPFRCTVLVEDNEKKSYQCESAFATDAQRKRHELTHDKSDDARKYKCQIEGCGKKFTRSEHLRRHALTHENVRNYTCDEPGCGKAFSQEATLKAHKLLHTGSKPHKCGHEGCFYSTYKKWNLTVHERIHSGERPHKCEWPGCPFEATISSALTAHSTKHSGVKPFACGFPSCNKRFSQSGSLHAHIRKVHGETNAAQYVIKDRIDVKQAFQEALAARKLQGGGELASKLTAESVHLDDGVQIPPADPCAEDPSAPPPPPDNQMVVELPEHYSTDMLALEGEMPPELPAEPE